MGIMAERLFAPDIQIIAGNQSCEGKDSAAQAFADDEHVGKDSVMFDGEHFSGAAEAMRYFIENQQCTVFIAGGADPLPIIRWRNERCASDSFGDDRGNVALLLEHVFDIIRAVQIATVAAFERAMSIVGGRDVLAAG